MLSSDAQLPVFRSHPHKEFPQVQPRVILQSRDGWIWMGGQGGLLRFDGWKFELFPLPDSTNDQVTALYETNDLIWVGFQSGKIGRIETGLSIWPFENFGAEHRPFSYWTPEEGTPASPVTGFTLDHKGNIWIATYGEGLYCLQGKRLYLFNQEEENLTSNDIYSIATDAQGNVWAATDAGISICSIDGNHHKTVRQMGIQNGLPDEIITALLPNGNDYIWIGTYDKGVCRYNMKTDHFDVFTKDWKYGHITSLAIFGANELWIGTGNNGLLCLDIQSDEIKEMPPKHALNRQKIGQILKDREGLLWVLSDRTGVFSANIKFSLLETPGQDVQAVCIDRHFQFWIGTTTGLLLRKNKEFRAVLPNQNIISLFELPDGHVLAGSFGEGLWVLDETGTIRQHLTEADGLTNGSILSITADNESIWLATLGGVTRLDWSGNRSKPLSNARPLKELGASYIYKVLIDKKNRLWLGTDGKGLCMVSEGKIIQYNEVLGHPLKTVYDIVEDYSGNIWFTTPSEGLFKWNGRDFQSYTTKQLLHSNAITSLSIANNNALVLGYEDGLDIFTPETGHVANHSNPTGLPAQEINLNADCKDRAGNIWLGTPKGLLRIAEFGEFFKFDPQPSITAITVLMESVDYQKVHTFSHNNNYFVFHFSGLWYTNPESVKFRYKLEGYDIDWKITKDQQTSYSNLPPGRYHFRVQTSEHGDFSHTPEAAYAFYVKKPVWLEWWFISLSVLLASGLFFLWIRSRDARFRRVAILRKEAADSQLAALKSQINPHFLFNSFNTLITIIEENPKSAVEYVEHLSDFYRSMMAYREKNLIPLQEEIEIVNNFYFLLRKRFEENFYLRIPASLPYGMIMPLTLQMLVENAVKHNIISKANPLHVEIYIENGKWIAVRNNLQPKMTPESSTHFGLRSLKERYQLINNQGITIEKTVTHFIVKVPIIRNS